MRQYVKKQCLDLLGVLNKAYAQVNRLIERHQTDEALELLEECQQGVISIGTMIEKAEGEGTEEVRQLESCFEVVWQLSEDIRAGEEINMRKTKRFG